MADRMAAQGKRPPAGTAEAAAAHGPFIGSHGCLSVAQPDALFIV